MIGNDVIDIAAARRESNWQRRGFLKKIFTIDEQLVIASSADPERMVWTLWSMKEAAYKIYNRHTGIRAFIPHWFKCTVNAADKGVATCDGLRFYTKTLIEGNMIHTVAVNMPDNLNNVQLISPTAIIKEANLLPYTICQISGQAIAASRSHHGEFDLSVCIASH